MLTNAFIGHSTPPTTDDLAAALGPDAHLLWINLVATLESDQLINASVWKSYSPKAGWALRLLKGKRVIVYLSPAANAFIATFILGPRAMEAAYAAKLPARTVKLLQEAKRYPEGTAVPIEVHKPAHARLVRTLAAIKLAH